MALIFDPQHEPAPTGLAPLDRADLADEAWNLAYDAVAHLPMDSWRQVSPMADLMSEFIGEGPERLAQFKRFLAGRTPAAGQNGLF